MKTTTNNKPTRVGSHFTARPMAASIIGWLLVLASTSIAWGANSTRTAQVKGSSSYPFTSFTVQTNNAQDTVTPPAGWRGRKTGPRTWEFTAGAPIPPGGAFTVTASRPGPTAPTVSIVGGDYRDNQGNHYWVTSCPDPLANLVIQAGAQPVTYLGYTIPAGEYGYFMEWWNPSTFTDQTKTASVFLGQSSGAFNFATIANSFTAAQLGQLQGVQIFGSDATLTDFMNASNATGSPGVPVSFSYNPSTGVASMTFDPSNPNQGVGAGESSELMAFTSDFGPVVSDTMNASAVYVSNYGCPGGSTYIPQAPEPGSLLLFGSGILGLGGLLRKRWAMRA